MIWFVVGLAALVLLGIWLEMLARTVVLHMIERKVMTGMTTIKTVSR